jgi:hypothetical protein
MQKKPLQRGLKEQEGAQKGLKILHFLFLHAISCFHIAEGYM